MPYKLEEMKFKKFRKLENFDIQLGERITVIAGQNGVGKSNILCLIAAASGIHKQRISGEKFHPDFEKYFHIEETEIDEDYHVLASFTRINEGGERYNFDKRLSLKNDAASERGIRIIPRTSNENHQGKTIKEIEAEVKSNTGIGGSGRVNQPTIFLSLSRLYPLGETQVTSQRLQKRKGDWAERYKKWYNAVLPKSILSEVDTLLEIEKESIQDKTVAMELRNTTVRTKSIGQDNLGSIISALLDFYMLSKEEKYDGGLLCIDEIDVSLHPSAQIKLLDLLVTVSEELNLQIVVTTHSLTFIKEILRLKNKEKPWYNLIYLKDVDHPSPSQIDNYEQIKADLFSEQMVLKPRLKVYMEDNAAKRLYGLLLKSVRTSNFTFDDSDYDLVPLELGCEILKNLQKKDEYFKNVLIILDGDAKYKSGSQPKIKDYLNIAPPPKHITEKKEMNIHYLPGEWAPEVYLFRIIYEYVSNYSRYVDFWRALDMEMETTNYTRQYVDEKIVAPVMEQIDQSPIEFIKRLSEEIFSFSEKCRILEHYIQNSENGSEIKAFFSELQKKSDILRAKRKSSLL